MPIPKFTTKVDVFKTLSEIQKILVSHGCQKIVFDNKNGLPVALTFSIEWQGSLVAFCLPCNFEGILKAMKKDKVQKSLCTEEQAIRVGWRILKSWVEAQLAIVESEMVMLPEVFLPYAVTKNGDTLFKHIQSNNSLLLSN